MGRRAVFVDRDGTINVEADYLGDPARLRLEPGAAAGLRRLAEAGFILVVVTNQSGVARGFYSAADVERVNAALAAVLRSQGVDLIRFYHCPHHPDGLAPEYSVVCDCRKPAPGLILRAAADHAVDLGASYLVGDSLRDLQAGRSAGVRTLLVRTGYGAACEAESVARGLADFVADTLAEAAEWIVADAAGEERRDKR